MAIPPVPAPTDESIQSALEAQARGRAEFTAATGLQITDDGRIVKRSSDEGESDSEVQS